MKNEDKKVEKVNIKDTEVNEHKYQIIQLLDNCEALTGHKREVGEGALFGVDTNTMTKNEFQKKVKEFLKKEVK